MASGGGVDRKKAVVNPPGDEFTAPPAKTPPDPEIRELIYGDYGFQAEQSGQKRCTPPTDSPPDTFC